MKVFLFIIVVLFGTISAQAHFIVDAQNREVFVLKAQDEGSRVILRFPLTLAYANELSQRLPNADFTAPFMQSEMERGQRYYRLNSDSIASNSSEFAEFLLRDFRFSLNGVIIDPKMPEFSFINTHDENGDVKELGSGLDASLQILDISSENLPDRPYISEALVVISFLLPEVGQTDPLKIELLSAPFPVPDGTVFETHITDLRDGSATLFTFSGTGFDPVILSGSAFDSFGNFFKQGIEHILTGYDHILFVLCLVMAARSLHLLVLAITGFTIGHSITLAAGAMGYIPHTLWFVPLIEFLVAISIVLMGAFILLGRSGKQGFWLAASIGLFHGFGFSFLLSDLLGSGGSTLIVALAGFNLGVEAGQLLIVAVSFSALLLIAKFSDKMATFSRYGIATFACIVALSMMYERSGILFEILS